MISKKIIPVGLSEVEILTVDYFEFDVKTSNTFTLYIEIKVSNLLEQKLELLQGIITLYGIYKGREFMKTNSSILFVSEKNNSNSNIYHCYCENLPLSLHNYITVTGDFADIDILNYYLNVQLIGSIGDAIPDVVLDKYYKLNLTHKSFTNELDYLLEGIYVHKEFNCFEDYRALLKTKSIDHIISDDEFKKNLISIVETGIIPSSYNPDEIKNVKEPKVGQQLYKVKTSKQTISIKLNQAAYSISAQSLILSISSTKQNLLSGISIQLFKKTRLSTIKSSHKLDKFTLFSATNQQSILFNLPIHVDQPTALNEQEYNLLIKFVEPNVICENDSKVDAKPGYFSNSKAMKHGDKSMLCAELSGTLGVFYIPILFIR
ncbi:hypothetical protein QEN19_001909 [Hanseniaspora menglaensis]